ncbi:MAG: PhoPQ-activated pathogenicity-related protein [Saprospiraceae bacterium]|jgi:PhoPQ-activated pathogenicity-related protein
MKFFKSSFYLTLLFSLVFIVACSPKISDNASSTSSIENLQIYDAPLNSDLLKKYVHTPDAAFEYEIVDKIDGQGYSTYVIKMISQKWLTEAEVEQPIWWHWLTMVVPNEIVSSTGMVFIGGGSHNSKQPTKPDDLTLHAALGTKSIVAELHNIPNQKTVFVGDDYGPRGEDELIAYGWRKFLEGGAKDEDAKWLARFPMTKAVVRAMDVITAVTKDNKELKTVDKFLIAGGSKRGWTTWTTGAVDDRVIAIAPIVIDMLNMKPSFEHHWRAYGAWAPAVNDYVAEGVMEWQDSREYRTLLSHTEPYSFRNSLTIPKLLLNGSGDQFFLPDSWQFYWDGLKGEKHLRYVPNSEHSMKKTDAIETLVSFYQMIVADYPRPDFDWEVKEGQIQIHTHKNHIPKSITLWQANNPNERNFQVEKIGRAYTSSKISLRTDGKYSIGIDDPAKGWSAFYAELEFAGIGDKVPLKLTTGIVVTPDAYPAAPFKSKAPMGHVFRN